MSRRTLGVRYGSGDRWTSPEPVGRTTRRSRTGRGTLGEVRERSGYPSAGLGRVRDHWVGPGQVEGTSRRSGTGQGTHPEVQDGSGEPSGCPGGVARLSVKFGMGQGTLGEAWDMSGDPRGGLEWVTGP